MRGCILQRFNHRCCASPQGHPFVLGSDIFHGSQQEDGCPHLIVCSNLLSQLSWLSFPCVYIRADSPYSQQSEPTVPQAGFPPYDVSLLLFHFYCLSKSGGWKNRTEQNRTQCTGFCSPQALISIFPPDPYLFLYICNSPWFFSGLGFPNGALLSFDYLDSLPKASVETFLTLSQITNPRWFSGRAQARSTSAPPPPNDSSVGL